MSNNDLSKLQSYPQIFFANGPIANSDGGTMIGHGIATVVLLSEHLAMINYQYTVSTAGTRSDIFQVGLNANILHKYSSIPAIRPITGGEATFYSPYDASGNWGAFAQNLNGYAGTNINNDEFWCFARNYNQTDIGNFPDNDYAVYVRVVGTCYGIY